MIRTYPGNITVELTGSVVTIKQDGELLKGQNVSPNFAREEYNKICESVSAYSKKKYRKF